MLLVLVVVALFTMTIVYQVHPDVTRPSMNHPNQIVLVQIATSHWLRLECATRSQIPRSLRSLIDAGQIVNDSIDDWTKRVSETQSDETMEQMDIDSVVGLMMGQEDQAVNGVWRICTVRFSCGRLQAF